MRRPRNEEVNQASIGGEMMDIKTIEEALSNLTSMSSVGLFNKKAPDYIRFLLDEVKRLEKELQDSPYATERELQQVIKVYREGVKRTYQDGVREGLKMAAEIVEELRKSQSPNYWIIAEAIRKKADLI